MPKKMIDTIIADFRVQNQKSMNPLGLFNSSKCTRELLLVCFEELTPALLLSRVSRHFACDIPPVPFASTRTDTPMIIEGTYSIVQVASDL